MSRLYFVDIDMTLSTRAWIDADSEEDARKIALERIAKDPYHYARRGAFLDANVTDCFIDEE